MQLRCATHNRALALWSVDQQFECDECHKIMKSSHALRKHKCPTNLEDRIKFPHAGDLSLKVRATYVIIKVFIIDRIPTKMLHRTYKNRHTLLNLRCKPTLY